MFIDFPFLNEKKTTLLNVYLYIQMHAFYSETQSRVTELSWIGWNNQTNLQEAAIRQHH